MESTLNSGLKKKKNQKRRKKEKKGKNQLLSQDPRMTAGHLYPTFSTEGLTLTSSGVSYSSNEHVYNTIITEWQPLTLTQHGCRWPHIRCNAVGNKTKNLKIIIKSPELWETFTVYRYKRGFAVQVYLYLPFRIQIFRSKNKSVQANISRNIFLSNSGFASTLYNLAAS